MKFIELKTNHPKLSLKKICETIEVCYQYVLKASKQPIPNQPYNPEDFNYEAVEKILERKGINLDSFDWETIESEIVIAEPINKIEDFEIGIRFTLREPKEKTKRPTYEVIFTTVSHIVFMDIEDTQPRVMNWETFQHQSPRIVKSKEEEGK